MHWSSCDEKTFQHDHFLFTHAAGDDLDELSEDEVAVVGMKTRQMRRDEINQSLVAKQQGMFKEPWCQLHSRSYPCITMHSLRTTSAVVAFKNFAIDIRLRTIFLLILLIQRSGTAAFIASNKELLKLDSTSEAATGEVCNKDTGGNQKCLQKWSRSLLHFVRGGGHIDSWSPLYS